MNKFNEPKYDFCDGCGWEKRIEIVTDNGNGYCRECVEDSLEGYHRGKYGHKKEE